MKNLAENNIIRFINITKKKDGLFANFRAKGIKGGTVFSASISVDISAAEVDPTDSLESIVTHCSKIAVKEFRASELQFEGISNAI